MKRGRRETEGWWERVAERRIGKGEWVARRAGPATAGAVAGYPGLLGRGGGCVCAEDLHWRRSFLCTSPLLQLSVVRALHLCCGCLPRVSSVSLFMALHYVPLPWAFCCDLSIMALCLDPHGLLLSVWQEPSRPQALEVTESHIHYQRPVQVPGG